ncbi:hypothetical protein F4604DRAFT_1913518 [Suillus subluteus]|nr:hypothetical protein F4604DRAFT_1913518 [Suillus subluteus]
MSWLEMDNENGQLEIIPFIFGSLNVKPILMNSFDWKGVASSHYKQILHTCWFPATSTDPRTAATFTVLEHFHLLSFESKVSAFKFYHYIAHWSDNTGVNPIKDQYSVFLRIMAEWRNIKALKHVGCGHDPAGVDTTQEGELVILCPACPHPGKNLVETLNDVAPGNRWIYSLFLAIDANFHLKRHLVSSDAKDPGLSRGWGYFVEERNYKVYLQENGTLTQEKSTCISHNAVNMADMKASKGLAAMGVGTVVCTRHDMRLANGVGDLQKGEKYLNMDYIVFSALGTKSFGIECQPLFPYGFIPMAVNNTAHIAACQTKFSFNWSPYVGRMDREAPEWGWANINRVAASTKEMAPGTCWNTLDDHFGDWNWKKVTVLDAVNAERDHCHALVDLEGSIKESDLDAASLAAWMKEIVAWENNHTKPNPFNSQSREVTQAAIHLALVQQDVKDLEEGMSISLHSEVTPSILISTGLDLKDAHVNLTQHSTNDQQTKVLMCSNSLQRCINSWIMIQVLYMPFVSHLRATGVEVSQSDEDTGDAASGCPKVKPDSIKSNDILLLLPSDICNLVMCDTKLLEVEWSLCLAQANDALDECCSHIRLRHQLLHFKAQHICGQGANTHAQKSIQAVKCRLILSHEKYSCAQQALICLSTHLLYLGWEHKLQQLRKSDLQPMGDLRGRTQGTAIMPWIWLTQGISADDSDRLQDYKSSLFTTFSNGLMDTSHLALRIKWCKTRARHNWWFEEIQLLLEEMRCIIEFLAWQAKWWDEQATLRVAERSVDVEGLAAYAKRQATIRRSLSARFQALWGNVPTLVSANLDDITADGPAEEGTFIDAPSHEDLDYVD